MNLADILSLALSVLACAIAGVSLWLTSRAGSPLELRSQVRQIDLDLHELFDTVEKWTRRDRVRRLRESREEPPAEQPMNREQHKALLRAKALGAGISS